MEAPVYIEPYNPAWPQAFLAERQLLLAVLEPWLAGGIEHVGSTAVPGLAAKPVIDIMAPVKDLESSLPALEALRGVGYCYFPYRPDVMHWLCKPNPEFRTHHLHLVPLGSALWIERLAFRDLLIAEPSVATDYAALKSRLASEYRHDRERYTEEKGPFIQAALRRIVHSPDLLPRRANGVVLRRLVPADLQAFQAYRSDPLVGQYQGWSAKSDAEAREFLAEMSTASLLQAGAWCQIGIADPDGSLVGDIGLFLSSDGREAQIGISLRRESQRRGMATAAVCDAIDLVFGNTRADRVVGVADARNLPSIRLLQRVGMHWVESREAVFREEPCVEHVYAISRGPL